MKKILISEKKTINIKNKLIWQILVKLILVVQTTI